MIDAARVYFEANDDGHVCGGKSGEWCPACVLGRALADLDRSVAVSSKKAPYRARQPMEGDGDVEGPRVRVPRVRGGKTVKVRSTEIVRASRQGTEGSWATR